MEGEEEGADDHRPDARPKVRFASDSPLEGDGFEPSVPREAAGILVISVLVHRRPVGEQGVKQVT